MFRSQLRQFAENLESLREFVDLVEPLLSEKHAEQAKKNLVNFYPLLLAMRKLDPESFPALDKLEEKIKKTKPPFEFDIELKQDGDKKSAAINIKGDAKAVQKAMKSFSRTGQQRDHLYKTSLISLISAVEWFASQLLHEYFRTIPHSIGSRDKQLSLDDLKAIGSVEEALDYLIDFKVEEILRGSFEDWMLFFKSHLKLSMNYLNEHKDFLVDAFLRRNLLIHNNGVINSLYIKKVPKKLKSRAALGEPLEIDSEYLEKAISEFERNFLLIGAELWKKLEPENDMRSTVLIELAYNHLELERWDISESLSYFVLNDKKLPERDRLVSTVNYWQSKKWKGEFEQVKDEISSSDFSAKNELFKLAQYALLGEFDDFFRLLPKVIDAEKLTTEDLHQWPLFQEVRKTRKYKRLYPKRKPRQTKKSAKSAT